ncbi:MAG: prepilin-type N-terminal cleavage/methylation domain-containing protein [Gemmatimonadetes bacterium]|nr:prepilin-type N-terminal cleavage/methylation domain-containing protein [Gemmatimonadota bacterium]
MAHRQGMTLIEMMVALVIFTLVLASALGALRSQTRGFDRGSDEMSVLQNMRFAADLMEQEIRAAGNNLAPSQPPVVYAGVNSVAINADLISNTAGDLFAVYVDPDASAAEVTGFLLANQQNIPQSSPAFNYPVADYFGNVAETIIFYFEPDTSTTDGADFRLMRQVNSLPAEVVVRNILPHADRPFFQYFHETAGRIDSVPSGWYPLSHAAAAYTGDQSVQINQLRAVEVNYTVSNGRTGVEQRTQQMSFVVSMPSTPFVPPPNCGPAPILGISLTATAAGWLGAERIDLTWPPAVDDNGGARDIERYIIWRRQGGGPWGLPYRSIPAGRTSSYLFSDENVVLGPAYHYLLAAQDCTPLMSPTVSASASVVSGTLQP